MNGPRNSAQIVGLVLLLGLLVAIAVRIRPPQPGQIVVQPAAVPKIVVEALEVPKAATPQIVITGSETPLVLSAAQNGELQSLRQQQIEALREQVEVLRIRFQQGSENVSLFIKAQAALLNAELAAASRPSDRIMLLEKNLEILSMCEETTKGRLAVGTGRSDDQAETKAAVAKARIELYLERLKQMSPGLETAPATAAPETKPEEAL